MKIKQQDYEFMKQEIDKIPIETRKQHFENLKSDERVKDINKRFRWDCLYAAKLNDFLCHTLYKYLDDTHIDTALKQITKECKR